MQDAIKIDGSKVKLVQCDVVNENGYTHLFGVRWMDEPNFGEKMRFVPLSENEVFGPFVDVKFG